MEDNQLRGEHQHSSCAPKYRGQVIPFSTCRAASKVREQPIIHPQQAWERNGAREKCGTLQPTTETHSEEGRGNLSRDITIHRRSSHLLYNVTSLHPASELLDVSPTSCSKVIFIPTASSSESQTQLLQPRPLRTRILGEHMPDESWNQTHKPRGRKKKPFASSSKPQLPASWKTKQLRAHPTFRTRSLSAKNHQTLNPF